MTEPTTTFEDGYYSGVCSRCKMKRTFWGTIRVSDTGRIFAEGSVPRVQYHDY
jgi:hypothetical protein